MKLANVYTLQHRPRREMENRIVWLHNKSSDDDQQKQIHGPIRGRVVQFLRFNFVTLFTLWCSVCKVSLLPLEGSHSPPDTVALLFTRVPISFNPFHVFSSLVLKTLSE